MTDGYQSVGTSFVTALDEWLDANVSDPYKAEPLAQHWARISKIGEEYGEAVSAFIGWTGQNPRKGFYASRDEVMNELCDVIITGILAIQHFTKSEAVTFKLLHDRWDYRLTSAGL